LVEHYLAKVDVTSSSLVSRSIQKAFLREGFSLCCQIKR
jgi:hypothetical protein